MLDLHNRIKVSVGIQPTTVADNTAIVGAIIDTQGFDSLEFGILSGLLADADATFALTMDESNDPALAGSNAVAAADIIGSLAAASYTFADDNVAKKIGYRGTKRYVRLTITPTNNTGSAPFAAVAIQGSARQGPVA